MKKILVILFIFTLFSAKLFAQKISVPDISISKADLKEVCSNYDSLVFALNIDDKNIYTLRVYGQTNGDYDDISAWFPAVKPTKTSDVILPCLLAIVKCGTKTIKRYVSKTPNVTFYFFAGKDKDVDVFAVFIQGQNSMNQRSEPQQLNPVPPKKPSPFF